jgi:hypothetical protein
MIAAIAEAAASDLISSTCLLQPVTVLLAYSGTVLGWQE